MHTTLPKVDRLLMSGSYRNVVLLVMDGLGMEVLQRCLPENGLLRSHLLQPLSAVFPSTTTAATTSLISGLNPGEHGWIGWSLHFEQLSKSVDTFSNLIQFTSEPVADYHAASTLLPYRPLVQQVSDTRNAQGLYISPYGDIKVNSLNGLVEQIIKALGVPGRHYVYAYWGEPDHTMHQIGCRHTKIRGVAENIEQALLAINQSLTTEDLVLVTADHGLIDAVPDCFEDHPHLERMLRFPPAVEPRAAALYVHQEASADFSSAFREAFEDRYLLMKGDQAIASGLFGPGQAHPLLRSLVGDYFAVATSDHALFQKREHCKLIGMHAGLTEQEMLVPLIALTKA
ncbi:MAG: hypothetical protein GX653_03640 [Clostridiales bacterium]|nr:hypothetical protein [Clostridiales bacterium]